MTGGTLYMPLSHGICNPGRELLRHTSLAPDLRTLKTVRYATSTVFSIKLLKGYVTERETN